MKKDGIVFVNDWGRDEDEDFEKLKVCDEVGLFLDNLNPCKKEKMISDLIL